MTEPKKKIEVKQSDGMNPVLAGIAGVVAGGVAVAAAVLMSDKKNQKKVADTVTGVKEKVTDYMDTMKSNSKEAKKA